MSLREPARILVSAGEPSGDLHGAAVIRELRQRLPGIAVDAIGGPKMQAAGAELRFPIERLSTIGFSTVLSAIPTHLRLLRTLRRDFQTARYQLVLLIDYPGFHLRVASAARRARVPVLYYIAPQAWAWRPQRTTRLREVVDRLAVILPFEQSFFEQAGLRAEFVGHPLLDSEPPPSRSSARAAMGMSFQERVLAIFPGSREAELKRHWPLFRDAALRLLDQGRCDRVVVAATGGGDYPDPGTAVVYREGSRDVLAAADVALIKSGTATLEAALAGVPMAVAYAASAVTNLVARRVMTVRWISLVNLVADRELVPEVWRDGVDIEQLMAALVPLLDLDSAERRNQLNGFATVRARLGEPGAASRVAGIAAGMLHA